MRHHNIHNTVMPGKQRGAALLISLLILIVLTIIGITGLSNTTLEERMSHNFQQSTMAYQGAESAIENILVTSNPEPDQNPNYNPDNDPMIDAVNAGKDDTSTVVSYTPAGSDVETDTTVVYIDSAACPGSSFGTVVCYIVEARAEATIDATHTETLHVQGFRRPGAEDYTKGIN
jgi:type IV pilus assembly protein PilX